MKASREDLEAGLAVVLPKPQAAILAALLRAGGPLTLGELAEATGRPAPKLHAALQPLIEQQVLAAFPVPATGRGRPRLQVTLNARRLAPLVRTLQASLARQEAALGALRASGALG